MFRKIILLSLLSVSIIACSGGDDNAKTVKVKSLQKNDKNLSCREILLEMNEAQFYNKMAHKNRGVKLKNVLMPLGYISTYMDAEDAINAAQARVEYLDRIYEIMHCQQQEKENEKAAGYKGKSDNSQDDEEDFEDIERKLRDEMRGKPQSMNEFDPKQYSGQYSSGYNQYSDGGSVRYYLEK